MRRAKNARARILHKQVAQKAGRSADDLAD